MSSYFTISPSGDGEIYLCTAHVIYIHHQNRGLKKGDKELMNLMLKSHKHDTDLLYPNKR